MTDPPPVPMPNWIKRSIGLVLLAAIIFAAATTTLALAGESTLPAPLSAIVTISFASAVVALLSRGLAGQMADRIITHIDHTVAIAADRQDRRMNSIALGMIEHGIKLEEITGEIPRVRPLVTACKHDDEPDGYARGYADGLARVPMDRKKIVRIVNHQN